MFKGLFGQKINGLKTRGRYAKFGIFYFRSSGVKIPDKLFLGGKWRQLKLENKSQEFFQYEFNEICINDCYNIIELGKLQAGVNVVVDIGANQGLFLIAARKAFPGAIIQCYEPNPNIIKVLEYNGKSLDAAIFEEAVTRNNCKVSLSFGETDLHSITKANSEGNVTGTAFSKVIERAGGAIDILKLDCEGAEWDLFDDADSWNKVKCVTMEYHLWAKPGSTPGDLIEKLGKMGFRVLHHDALSADFGLLTAIKK